MDSIATILPGIIALDATKYSWIASLTVMIYDYVLTLGNEVFIWRHQRWSLGKGLYLFLRYLGLCIMIIDVVVAFLPNLGDKFCRGFFIWIVLSVLCSVLSAELVLLFRVYAVYGCSLKILTFAGGTLAIGLTATCLIIGLDMPVGVGLSFGLTGCGISQVPPIFFYAWISPMVNETIFCVLMVWKAWDVYKHQASSPLFRIIVRDSALYFFSIFLVLLFNCLIWLLKFQLYVSFGVGWEITIACTMGSRLLMNIMTAPTDNVDNWPPTQPTMRFRSSRTSRISHEVPDISAESPLLTVGPPH